MRFLTNSIRLLAVAAAFVATECCAEDKPQNVAVPEGMEFVREVGGIAEYRLAANGLQVLLKPDATTPVVTFMVTYRVGSRNEVTGTTGATHLLEHLMFKGTAKHNKEAGTGFDQTLERTGAETNATTWLDRTNYFETVPAEHLATVIGIEADRMRNLRLREEDRRPEMTVVRNEYEIGENSPSEALDKEIWAAAFLAHPYHHTTIGWRSDIEKVSIEKLREFYDTFYWPDNATVTVIGNFAVPEALALILQHYGPIPRAPKPIPQVYTEEPPQSGPRRVMMKRPGELAVVSIAHKIPAGTHPDYAPLWVLDAILTDGANSRCFRGLTDKGLTSDVSSMLSFNRDPSLYVFYASLAPEAPHDTVEKALRAILNSVAARGVTEKEVASAIARLLATTAFNRDGSFAMASELNECIACGDWTLYTGMLEALKKVTVADVNRVAAKYLVEDQSVTGWFVPTEAAAAEEKPAAKEEPTKAPAESANPTPARSVAPQDAAATPAPTTNLASRVVTRKLGELEVLCLPTGAKDIVTLRGSLPAGSAHAAAAGNEMLAELCAGMLDRGTKKTGRFELAAKLEAAGATIDFSAGTDTLDISAKCLRKDVPLLVALLAEQLRLPLFSKEEFAKLKKQIAAEAEEELESTSTQASLAFTRALFPPGHPHRDLATSEMLALVGKATLPQVAAFHQKHYGPSGMVLVAVGDLEPAEFSATVEREFAGWQGGGVRLPADPPLPPSAPSDVQVDLPAKESVTVRIGQPSKLQVGAPGHAALYAATAALGSGFTSRLISTVRDTEGLTYSIGASMGGDSLRPGWWVIRAEFAPSLLDNGLAATRRELEHWRNDGLNAAELDYIKSHLSGSFTVSLATTDGLASTLLGARQRGQDAAFLDTWPQQIRAVTLEEANRTVRELLDPEKMTTVKAGSFGKRGASRGR